MPATPHLFSFLSGLMGPTQKPCLPTYALLRRHGSEGKAGGTGPSRELGTDPLRAILMSGRWICDVNAVGLTTFLSF